MTVPKFVKEGLDFIVEHLKSIDFDEGVKIMEDIAGHIYGNKDEEMDELKDEAATLKDLKDTCDRIELQINSLQQQLAGIAKTFPGVLSLGL